MIPRNMYSYGAKWTGADISENQILYAGKLSKSAGMDIDYIVASAEEIDFPDRTFDVVTACQCFMYFDKSIVLPKLHQMLKDHGHFAILFMVIFQFYLWHGYQKRVRLPKQAKILF